jgi:hypothetical protein
MAESKSQRKLRCEIHYLPDRHALQKLSQAYRWLVPESVQQTVEKPEVTLNHDEKARRHLRSSLL